MSIWPASRRPRSSWRGGAFTTYVSRAPQADLNPFGLVAEPDFAFIRRGVEATPSTCLFVRDFGWERGLA